MCWGPKLSFQEEFEHFLPDFYHFASRFHISEVSKNFGIIEMVLEISKYYQFENDKHVIVVP